VGAWRGPNDSWGGGRRGVDVDPAEVGKALGWTRRW
jgi:hypothetical protein